MCYLKKLINIPFLLLILFSCIRSPQKVYKLQIDYDLVNREAIKESLIPVRPGIPGERPFWNPQSRMFMYAPAFDFKCVKGAVKYQFELIDSSGISYAFVAEEPWSDLGPIWKHIPVGPANLKVFPLDKNEQKFGQAQHRSLYKASPFKGPYHEKKGSYRESARKALSYIYKLDHVQMWLKGVPSDTLYHHYGYPSKIVGSLIDGMLMFSRLSPGDSLRAMTIAINAASYLLENSEPEGAPLQHFPQTYYGTYYDSNIYKGQLMLQYPSRVANTYLNLYKATGDTTWYGAALRIADTYQQLQLPSGTWKLKLWKDGSEVNPNVLVPTGLLALLDRFENEFGLDTYQEMKKHTFSWLMENPVKSYYWESQFEDIEPGSTYKNMTKYGPCSFADHLFENHPNSKKYISLAEELVRFAEDQFVVWEQPLNHEDPQDITWITPCVLEQYDYYVPVNASASTLMHTFLSAFKTTHKSMYLAKAIELANTTLLTQEASGNYPTYWQDEQWNDWWLNCAIAGVKVMLEMEDFMSASD